MKRKNCWRRSGEGRRERIEGRGREEEEVEREKKEEWEEKEMSVVVWFGIRK